MANDLLILARPGDELRLAAPLLFSEPACDVEIRHACTSQAEGDVQEFIAGPGHGARLDEHFASRSFWEDLIAVLKSENLHRFRRVIVPSIHSTAPNSILCAAVGTLGLSNLWMIADALHDEVFEVDRSRVAALIDACNEEFERAGSTGLNGSRPFETIAGLRKVESADIVNYAAYLGLPHCPRFEWLYAAVDSGSDPWGLASSAYEHRRHKVELELLNEVDWSSLAEVGACTGIFTQKIVDRYGGRRVTAVENDELFLRRLRNMAGPSISVFEGSIFDFRENAEVFVLASCIYDMEEFPAHVFDLAKKAILTSHRPDFERDVVEQVCTSHGWRKLVGKVVPPAVEVYCGEPIARDGSIANLWAPLS